MAGDRAVVDADDRFPAAVEVGSFDLAARVELRRVAVGAGVLLPDLIVVELGVDVATVPVELGVLVDLEPEPRREGEVAIGIDVDIAATGREAGRHGRVVGRERAREGQVVVEAALAAAHVGAAVAPQPRAELGEGLAVHRPLAGLGDQVDDAADRLAAVHRAHRAAHDLDAVEVLGQQMREIGRAIGSRRIVDGDAVDQHQHMVGIGAADEDRRLRARPARLLHRDAGHGLQHLARRPQLAALHLLLGNDRVARGDLVRVGREAVGGHDQFRKGADRLGLGEGRKRRKSEKDKQQSTEWRHRTIPQSRTRTRRVTARLTVPSEHPVRGRATLSPAGLLARGSLLLPAFPDRSPVASWAVARRLQLRVQPPIGPLRAARRSLFASVKEDRR